MTEREYSASDQALRGQGAACEPQRNGCAAAGAASGTTTHAHGTAADQGRSPDHRIRHPCRPLSATSHPAGCDPAEPALRPRWVRSATSLYRYCDPAEGGLRPRCAVTVTSQGVVCDPAVPLQSPRRPWSATRQACYSALAGCGLRPRRLVMQPCRTGSANPHPALARPADQPVQAATMRPLSSRSIRSHRAASC